MRNRLPGSVALEAVGVAVSAGFQRDHGAAATVIDDEFVVAIRVGGAPEGADESGAEPDSIGLAIE
jgi:hypothetical protein